MTVRARPAPANGFTLIELLVALFIFALLSAAGVTLLRTSTTGQKVLGNRLDQLSIINRATGALTADLLQAVPRLSRNELGDPLPAFSVNGASLTKLLGVPFSATRPRPLLEFPFLSLLGVLGACSRCLHTAAKCVCW